MRLPFLLLMIVLGLAATAAAAEQSLTIAVRDGGFVPAEVKAPRGERVRVEVVNETTRKVEFESFQLNREHVIKPGGRATFFLQGLAPGRYEFFDEMDREHRGVLLVE